MVTILIVDDTRFMRAILRDIIIKTFRKEVTIVECEDGDEVIETYKEYKPDLVISNITMPKIDGISAMKEILAFDPKAKVILCSAVNRAKTIVEAYEVGATDFIVKPFKPEEVIKALRKHLKGLIINNG